MDEETKAVEKKTRKAADRGLTTTQIKLLGHLARVDVATPQGLQAANVSDRTPKTVEVLEREGYIELYHISPSGSEQPGRQHRATRERAGRRSRRRRWCSRAG